MLKDGETTSFEIINNIDETISNSNRTQYGKGEYFGVKSSGELGTPHHVRVNLYYIGKYKFNLQW